MNLKSLLKDTAIYGLSSIVGRFLNYLLVPLHTYFISAASGGYGIVSNLYAYTGLFLALLTFGMETTLFRFSSKDGEDADKVYGTTLRLVGGVAIGFITLVMLLLGPISGAMGYATHPEYVACMAIIVGMDAFQAIMFSRLRQQGRPFKFMTLKIAFIIPNVLLNVFIFVLMPKMFAHFPALEQFFIREDHGVGLIFFVNLICTALVFIGFGHELKGLRIGFDNQLARRMLRYTWPLLVLSLVGVLNQVADKILFPYLMPGQEGKIQLGIYGACVKVAMIMSLLTQAFRYAYEPIVFNGSRDRNNPDTLADGMKYFIIFTLLAYLAVMFYMPILKHFIQPAYHEGLGVIPIVMLAEIFMGIYFNLSFWYKLTDKTHWGAIMSAIGASVMIGINIALVPRFGYWACAWGGFAGYGTAMLLSYFIGQKYYPIRYDLKTIGFFAVLTAILYYGHMMLQRICSSDIVLMAAGTLLLILFCAAIFMMLRRERKA